MKSNGSVKSNDGERLVSAINSLKELFTIVMAIALTNAMFQFIAPAGSVRLIKDFPVFESFVFVLLIMMTIRFYHGNIRHLDEVFVNPLCNGQESTSVKTHPRFKKLGVDFIAVFMESLIFCVMSFYFRTFNYLFGLLTLLLIVDVIWFAIVFGSSFQELQKSVKQLNHQTNWLLVNLFTLVAHLVFIAFFAKDISIEWQYCVSLVIFFANVFADFAFNWKFYLPSFSIKPST